MTTMKPGSIDEYIATFPNDVQAVLDQIRATIQKTAPDAEETIKYGMPLKNNLLNNETAQFFYPNQCSQRKSMEHPARRCFISPLDKCLP
ncbi:MAG: DUF1801 domain-containing protein [Haliscomenobacteraceae bacterium CHB4]|nr:DUF1801 domain-containing protein [Haliscomenobacteraceae bacterium CHB4]